MIHGMSPSLSSDGGESTLLIAPSAMSMRQRTRKRLATPFCKRSSPFVMTSTSLSMTSLMGFAKSFVSVQSLYWPSKSAPPWGETAPPSSGTKSAGSTGVPLGSRISKWQCGPVELPVEPWPPMRCPALTVCPVVTWISSKCP